MCGITGILSKSKIAREVIENMTSAVAHRGPDSQGIYLNEAHTLALGHRRLSVIDLSPSANQPMNTHAGRYAVVFNGEIYNFKELRAELERKGYEFSTHSDTEVILHAFDAWGKSSFEKLKGMFAIALYDRNRNCVYLVRDHLGKKPLFIYRDEQRIAFASEIKALLKIPGISRQTNKSALAQFLHLGYIPEPLTPWTNIEKLPSGSVGEVDADLTLKISSFWTPVNSDLQLSRLSDKEIRNAFEERLNRAVERRLISDVPLGALLSGGTDSSLVCAIASKLLPRKLNTFSIGFEDAAFDESKYAAKVSAALGTDHHTFMLKEKNAVELVESYLQHFDEPFADSSAIPLMLLSHNTRKEVTVALTGDGGDELFLGYGSYTWAARVKKYGWARNLLPGSPGSKPGKATAMLKDVPINQLRSHIFSQEQGFFSAEEVADITGIAPGFVYTDPTSMQERREEEKQAFFDLNHYLKDDLLVKVDRASMKYALECRCPLLDTGIVEFALQLPYRFKVRNGATKYLLKTILSEFLPDDLVHRKKWGFGIPLATWLQGDLRYLVQTYLDPGVVEEIGFVRSSAVADLVRRFNSGEVWLYHRIWALVCLHYWWKKQEG